MDELKRDPGVDYILQLLTYVIVADAKIYQKEVGGFLSTADNLALRSTDGETLSKGWLFDWFLQNREQIRNQSAKPDVDSQLVKLFMRLQSWPEPEKTLSALRAVAASDGHFHINEKVLIALAAAYWGIETPNLYE